MSLAVRTLCLVLVVVVCYHRTQSFSISNQMRQIKRLSDAAKLIRNAKGIVKTMRSKSFNFAKVARGARILVGNVQLNKYNLRATSDIAMKVLPLLHGFSFEDRVKAWGLLSEYARIFAPHIRNWRIEDLHLFEKDVILSLQDIRELLDSARTRKKRKITSIKTEKWGKVIPWKFDGRFSSGEQTLIRQALQHWQSRTCLRFAEKTGTVAGSHLMFVKDLDLCYSLVGKKPQNGQPISIGLGCNQIGIILHEIGHALGMWHEQARPDRDLYINLNKQNIRPGEDFQFQARTWEKTMSIGVPYDYGSVMHYGRKDFTVNNRDTLSPKAYGYEMTIGQTRTTSFYDVKVINYQYCGDSCGQRILDTGNCENDGYQDPNNCGKCICPEGFKPPFCKKPQDNSNANCGANELVASTGWKEISSPGYPKNYPGPSTCNWRITAPSGTKVALVFAQPFSMRCPQYDTCDDYIEVRYRDLALTGPRFCCVNRPLKTIRSEGKSVLLLFRSTAQARNSGFKIRYRAEGCGGCLAGSPKVQAACQNTYRYTCQGTFKCNWLGRKKCKRFNTCLRTVKTCCANYKLTGNNCIRN